MHGPMPSLREETPKEGSDRRATQHYGCTPYALGNDKGPTH
jgi:hypothetical protein